MLGSSMESLLISSRAYSIASILCEEKFRLLISHRSLAYLYSFLLLNFATGKILFSNILEETIMIKSCWIIVERDYHLIFIQSCYFDRNRKLDE